MDYIEVRIGVKALNDLTDKEDDAVPGVYSVQVQKGLSDQSIASSALDRFHSEVPVGVLDDFAFFVFDPISGQALEESDDHESYSKKDLAADVRKIGDEAPNLFSVTVEAIGDDHSVTYLGTRSIVADSKEQVRERAMNLMWDERLDAASCSPRFQVETYFDKQDNRNVSASPRP